MTPENIVKAICACGYFYCYDANGNVTDLVDTNGNSVAHYEYGPFGGTITQSGSLADDNPFRFSSKYLDEDVQIQAGNDHTTTNTPVKRSERPKLSRSPANHRHPRQSAPAAPRPGQARRCLPPRPRHAAVRGLGLRHRRGFRR